MTHPPSGGAAPHAPRAMDCSEARISLGVYVLGAIDPAERSLVDSHLATCRDCRDELAGLAGLPALLARVSTEEAIALAVTGGPDIALEEMMPEPPRELLATVLDLTAARRRGRRWREAVFGLAAALIIAAGVFGGLRLSTGPAPLSAATGPQWPGQPNGAWETAHGQTGAMTAAISYRSMGWGTQIESKVAGIPVGTSCNLYVIDATGHHFLAGSWVTDNDEGTVWYPSSSNVPASDVAGFQVTVAHGQPIDISA